MFDKIISYSIHNKFVVGILVLALIVWGIFSLKNLPIDAVPDITNNQIQIITISPNLATQEIEQFITTQVELSLQNIQQLIEIRSISRFGLSVVTVVFQEDLDIYLARQLVSESLNEAQENIPEGLGTPEMAPLSTGLGEIYQYVVRSADGYEDKYSITDLRSIQDWIVKRQLSGIEGVVEINTFGGYLKQYEVAVNPNILKSMNISISEVYDALINSNENTGGAYIEKNPSTYYIRTNGIAKSLNDIGNIVIKVEENSPILIKDVAKVQFGKAPRYGAFIRDGKEAVGGKVMMLKGANSHKVTELIKERVEQIQKSLPEGVLIEPFLVRDKLINTAIGTVKTNLLEGGLIVIFILVLMLGNWRAGLIVASVIPLAMLFAVSMMKVFGISANLMSLGAIDFGLIVDGAVIIVESIVHRLSFKFAGQKLTQKQMDKEVLGSSLKIRNSAAFGEIIILMVYIPILALVGIEGKMFKPMGQTVILAIIGALILSLTYVPMMSALFLNKNISNKKTIADTIINFFYSLYSPILELALKLKTIFVAGTIILFIISLFVFKNMGGEFIPTLEEGDLAMHQLSPPGTSLSQSIEMAKLVQKKLLEFPEIEDVITNIGSAEIPTDPMPVEIGDIIIIMKPKEEWTTAKNRKDMYKKLEESMHDIPGLGFEFSQPIQMRFNELMSGSRADIAVKLYGEDLNLLFATAKDAEKIIKTIRGVATVSVEQTVGMPQIVVNYKYDKMAQYGLQVKKVNQIIRTSFAGEKAGVIYEDEKIFDLVVRLDEENRKDIHSVKDLYINLENGSQIPLSAVADIDLVDAPMQISRENTKRKIVIGINVGDRDMESLVSEIKQKLDSKMNLPIGYYFNFGGQFDNLKAAKDRLAIALPIALALIFILLYFTFGSISQALLIYVAIPLSAIGGIWALQLRDMPFSISAGIGFIALFGVAVLNGIVLIGYFNQLKNEGINNIKERIMLGTKVRFRAVLLTAAVASLGFLPMALSHSGGAEVQRPLATVVIGGLISATFLTLIILPIIYYWLAKWQEKNTSVSKTLILIPLLFFAFNSNAQREISLEEAIELAFKNNPQIKTAELELHKAETLSKVKYSLGNTDVYYKGDALFKIRNEQVNQIGITQHFKNPATIISERKFYEQLYKKTTYESELIKKKLKMEVQQIYFELQEQKDLAKLYFLVVNSYKNYEVIAKNRFKLGLTNKIELLVIQSTLGKKTLIYNEKLLKVNLLENNLRNLIGEKCTSFNSLKTHNYSSNFDFKILQIEVAKQDIEITKAYIKKIKSENSIEFNIGYSAQKYYNIGWLNGLEGSISFPLFNTQNKRRVSAQKIQVDIAKTVFEQKDIEYKQLSTSLKTELIIAKNRLKFYKEQVENINPEMERIADLNYKSGNISYLELINTLEILIKDKENYLKWTLEHNRLVTIFEYYNIGSTFL